MLGVAIVGCGAISRIHAQALSGICGVQLMAVFDSNWDKAQCFGEEYRVDSNENVDEMLARDDVNVVSLCTPSGLHEAIAIRAAKTGKHVVVDIDRLLEVAAVAHETGNRIQIQRYYFSADTNEQCDHPDYIVELLTKLKEMSPRTFEELLYVEQPTERDLSTHRFDMRKAAAMKPVILDESLVDLSSFQMAMELGWSGIALKTCKCHTHVLLFACLAEEHRLPYTVQDLTNPGISLIHSVGLAARLNPMMGVEANSVQFFPRASEAEADVHAGLFQRKNGKVSTKSILGNGLGYRVQEIGYEE
jgi:hypothetical protein